MALSDACSDFHHAMCEAGGDLAAMRTLAQKFRADVLQYGHAPYDYEPTHVAVLVAAVDGALAADDHDVAEWNLLLDLADAFQRFHDTPPGVAPAVLCRPAAGWRS